MNDEGNILAHKRAPLLKSADSFYNFGVVLYRGREFGSGWPSMIVTKQGRGYYCEELPIINLVKRNPYSGREKTFCISRAPRNRPPADGQLEIKFAPPNTKLLGKGGTHFGR